MKEKVLYVKLPENAQYRRVKVTEDGMIGIVYSEECTCQAKKETMKVEISKPKVLVKKETMKVEIPKPKVLVGGSEVYQKDDVPYWYCKIKNGRDEFMHLYMEDLTEEDLLYDSKTERIREFSTNKQKKFRADVLKALANKPKEGYCWIPVFEPSADGKEGLQFVKGKKPLVGLSCLEWDKKLRQYSPANESGKSSKTTYFLLLLRWLKDDIATLEQLAEHSEEIGHYADSKNAKYDFERTGERKFGGLYGFVGNTYKIVKNSDSDSGYSELGAYYFNTGGGIPLASVNHINYPDNANYGSVGWLELKK